MYRDTIQDTGILLLFFFVNELRRVDNGEKNFCCDLGSPRQDMHPPFLHFCWGRNWLLPSWKRASCFATRIPWCVWMMACFSVTTMLYCYIEFQHRYFHCEEYCILHNGRHFLNVFPHANWTSSVCFSRFFSTFLLQRPFEKLELIAEATNHPKRIWCRVPSTILLSAEHFWKTPAWPNSDSKEVFLSFLSHSLFCPFLILSAFSKMFLENTKPSTGSSFVYGSSTSLELCSF